MLIKDSEHVDLSTPSGPMRTYVFRPAAPGKYPGILFYSEIFQLTDPVRRTAAMIAGHGYVVAVPEIYHELEPRGAVLGYDQAGADIGNRHKIEKPIAAYDADARAVLEYLKSHKACSGRLGAFGICIGGHLAFRAAMNPDVLGTVCFYATDIHKGSLGLGQKDNSLERASEIKGELLMIWGRQDPHVSPEGRRVVYDRLMEVGTVLQWHEVNGQHAFLRDEGPRYDPALARQCYGIALELFHRKLGLGDLSDAPPAAPESRH